MVWLKLMVLKLSFMMINKKILFVSACGAKKFLIYIEHFLQKFYPYHSHFRNKNKTSTGYKVHMKIDPGYSVIKLKKLLPLAERIKNNFIIDSRMYRMKSRNNFPLIKSGNLIRFAGLNPLPQKCLRL